jgi:hypothetical protein
LLLRRLIERLAAGQVAAALRQGSAVVRLRFPRLRRGWLGQVRHAAVS